MISDSFAELNRMIYELLDAVGTTIRVLPAKTSGYHDILVLQHESYEQDDVVLYKYGKGKYAPAHRCFSANYSNPTLPSVKKRSAR